MYGSPKNFAHGSPVPPVLPSTVRAWSASRWHPVVSPARAWPWEAKVAATAPIRDLGGEAHGCFGQGGRFAGVGEVAGELGLAGEDERDRALVAGQMRPFEGPVEPLPGGRVAGAVLVHP